MTKQKKDKGFIALYRDILDHWIWTDNQPFDRRSAWIDLLLMVNHSDNTILSNDELIKLC